MPIGKGITRRAVASRGVQLGGAVGAAAIAGCGQEPAAAIVSKDVRANLVWLIWSSNTNVRGEAYNAITTAFQQEYPNVTVEQISGGGNLQLTLDKLSTMVAGDQPLDLVGTQHAVLGFYVNSGILKDLAPLARRDSALKFGDHMPTAVDMLSWKGLPYALPIGMSTSAVAYNADLFAKGGVKLPDGSWNWSQYLETAQRLTVRKPDETQWGTHILPSASEIFYWIWMNGGEPLIPKEEPTQAKFSAPEVLEAVQWFNDLGVRYQVKAPAAVPDGKGSNGKFEAGRVAFFPVQSNNTRELQDETFTWDVVALPKGKKSTVYPLNSFSYGVYNNTKQLDLAWKFWTTVVGPTGQREWMLRTGEFIPSHKSLAGEYEKMSLRPANRKVFLQAVASGRHTPKATKWKEMEPILNEQLQAADAGALGVKAMLETLDQQLATVLAGR
ncbi:MAG: ABC transporter substrate-binding protein [Chloroflexota bacterium]